MRRIKEAYFALEFELHPLRHRNASAKEQLGFAEKLWQAQQAVDRLYGRTVGFQWDGHDDAGWTNECLNELAAEVVAAEAPEPDEVEDPKPEEGKDQMATNTSETIKPKSKSTRKSIADNDEDCSDNTLLSGSTSESSSKKRARVPPKKRPASPPNVSTRSKKAKLKESPLHLRYGRRPSRIRPTYQSESESGTESYNDSSIPFPNLSGSSSPGPADTNGDSDPAKIGASGNQSTKKNAPARAKSTRTRSQRHRHTSSELEEDIGFRPCSMNHKST